MAPLTERVLSVLPGPRGLWMVAWAVVGPLALLMAVGYPPPPDVPIWGIVVVFGYGNIVALWGVNKIRTDLQTLQPRLARLLGPVDAGRALPDPFRGLGSTWGPLVLAGLLVGIELVLEFIGAPGLLSGALVVLLFAGFLPLATGLWVYFTLLVGLDRLGRMPLNLLPYYEDRSLGLRPLGSLAFSAFLMFAAVIGPIAIYVTDHLRDALILLTIFLGGVALFFVSLLRLHQQLVATKAERLAWARTLYAQVYKPVEASGSLDTFLNQAPKIEAAEVLERRVTDIQEWPFDDSILKTLTAVMIGEIAAVIVRLVLSQFGL